MIRLACQAVCQDIQDNHAVFSNPAHGRLRSYRSQGCQGLGIIETGLWKLPV